MNIGFDPYSLPYQLHQQNTNAAGASGGITQDQSIFSSNNTYAPLPSQQSLDTLFSQIDQFMQTLGTQPNGQTISSEPLAPTQTLPVTEPSTQTQGSMNAQNAADIIRKNFGIIDSTESGNNKDGLLTSQDLQQALKREDLSPELKQAITIASNQDIFSKLDTALKPDKPTDNMFSMDDLNKFMVPDLTKASTDISKASVTLIKENFDTLDTLGGNKDGLVGVGDLKAALNNNGLTPELKQALSLISSNQALLDNLDTVSLTDKNNKDALFNIADLDKFLGN